MKVFLIVTICSWTGITGLLAQDTIANASPGLRYQQKPKGIVISYDRILGSPVTSSSASPRIGSGKASLDKVEEMKFKLKLPVEWKGRTRFFTGINYSYQEYKFINPENLDYELYDALENRHLNALGTQLYVTHSFDHKKFLISRAGVELNGDYTNDFVTMSRFLKVTMSGLYGWKKSEDLSYGFGIFWNYDLGGPSVYPIFMYNRNFSPRLGVEATFPKEVYLRWNASTKMIFYGGYEVSGSTFQLVFKDPQVWPATTLELQRSGLRLQARAEREIFDFLWAAVSTGYHFTVNMDLTERHALYSLDRELINTRFGPAPFITFEIFVVPPSSLLD